MQLSYLPFQAPTSSSYLEQVTGNIFFSDKNQIIDRGCNWKPLHYYLWDEVKYFSKIPQDLGNALSIVNGGKYLKNALENP